METILNIGVLKYKLTQYNMLFFALSLSSSGRVRAQHRWPGAGLQVSPEQQGWYIYSADSQYS